jgi:hypothetical protein
MTKKSEPHTKEFPRIRRYASIWSRVSKETFQIAYDGEALSSGAMDVYELAPALLSIGDLVKSSNAVLNGDRATVTVSVESDFKKGSFEVSLILDQSLVDQVKAFLPGHDALGASALVSILFGTITKGEKVVSSLFRLLKLLKGEKPKEIIRNDTSGITVIVTGDGNKIDVASDAFKVYEHTKSRHAAEKVLAPVATPGISKFEARRDGQVTERFDKEDLPAIFDGDVVSLVEAPEDVTTSTREALLKVIKPNFEKGQWGFDDGSSRFGAKMEDKEFVAKVNAREIAFYSGDVLKVRLRTEQSMDAPGKIRTVHAIEEVLEYNPKFTQSRLELPSPEGPKLLGE